MEPESTDPNLDWKEIVKVFRTLHGYDLPPYCFFERGRWWLCQNDTGQYYAVIDTEDGLAFEEVEGIG